jgi:hypothetical protein
MWITYLLWSVYAWLGLVSYGAYPRLSGAMQLLYFFLFPVHWAVLGFIRASATYRGPFLDNPWIWYGLGIPFLLLVLLCGL